MSSQATVAQRVRAADGLRLDRTGAADHKEWMHFLVFARADDGTRLDLLVNLSLTDGVQAGDGERAVARVTLLAAIDDRWFGGIRRFAAEDCDLAAGRVDMRCGDQVLAFEDGAFWLDVADPAAGIAGRLMLVPTASPLVTPSAPMDGGRVRWVITPRLRARGVVEVHGCPVRFDDAPAYHDHNFGRFRWGGDFSWHWGVLLDEAGDRFAIVSRVLDAAGHRLLSESLMVGDAGGVREFRGAELDCSVEGLCRDAPALRVPTILELAVPERRSDVPRSLSMAARTARGEASLTLDVMDHAEIGIPNDHAGGGVSLLSEARARGRLTARFGDETLAFEGPALWEFTRVV